MKYFVLILFFVFCVGNSFAATDPDDLFEMIGYNPNPNPWYKTLFLAYSSVTLKCLLLMAVIFCFSQIKNKNKKN